MKKKILTVIAALTCASTCAVALTACGGGDNSNGGGDGPATTNSTVTAAEWEAAFAQVTSDNLTSTDWRWDSSDGIDVSDVTTNKQNANYMVTFKAAKDLNSHWSWIYGEHLDSGDKEKIMFQMLYAGGETVTGGVQYYYLEYLQGIPQWMYTDKNLQAIEQEMNTWNRSYGYTAFMKYAEKYDKFTYVKAENLYRYTVSFDDKVDQIIDIKFQDKKIVSYTDKSSTHCLELTDFGTTTVPEKPTAMAPKMDDAVGKTFYLAEVNAYDSDGKTTTDQNTLEVAGQLKDNLNKTVICKSQPTAAYEEQFDGVVKGTCVFVPGGAFDDLTGDDVVYWKKSDVDGYHGAFRFENASGTIANCKFEFGVITERVELQNGNYVELIFRMQDDE